MSDEKFLLEYEKLLNEGYCDCNEMNCIDNDSPRRILKIAKNLQQENEELKKQLEISETNEETYYLELKQIGECLELNKDFITEDIYQKINVLKKQLEDYKKRYQTEILEISKLRQLWLDSKLKTIQLENQQKEFIDWLDNLVISNMDVFTEIKVCDVLSKYKEIIGG